MLHRAVSFIERSVWAHYASRARELGLEGLSFVVSFDCDTDSDAKAALSLSKALSPLGVRPVFAVPGVTLERNAEIYKELAAGGAQFLNHGYLPHVEAYHGGYRSITWYRSMRKEEIAHDIQRGHDAVERVLQKTPVGFRTPHFGTFNSSDQLTCLYRILFSRGYVYSSSTMPLKALLRGPFYSEAGISEFPLSGTFYAPWRIWDSWSLSEGGTERVLKSRFSKGVLSTADAFLRNRIPALLNYYVDPSHVISNDVFLSAVQGLLSKGAKNVTYADLLIVNQKPKSS